MFLKTFHDAFDRVDLWLDRHPGSDWSRLLPVDAKATLAPVDIAYNPTWPYELTLYQPDLPTLLAVQRLLGTSIAVKIVYVEVARDFPTKWTVDAKRLQIHYLRSTTLRYGPKVVRKHKRGYYFGKPGRPLRLVTYADRKSKLASAARGHWCLHTEVRLQSLPAVRAAGIDCFDALIDFDFVGFWELHVRHWAIGNRTEFGVALGRSRVQKRVQSKGLQARAHRALNSSKHMAGNVFALQMLWRKHPTVTDSMKRLTTVQWLRLAAREVHKPPRKWR